MVDPRVESWFGISVAPPVQIEGPRYYDTDSFTVRKRELWASWESRDRREGWTSREHGLYLRHRLHQQLEAGVEGMLQKAASRARGARPKWLMRDIERAAASIDRIASVPHRSGMATYHAAVGQWTSMFVPPPLLALRDECDSLVARGAKYGVRPSDALDSMKSFGDLVRQAERLAPWSQNCRCELTPWRRRRKRRQLKRSARFKAKKRGRKRR